MAFSGEYTKKIKCFVDKLPKRMYKAYGKSEFEGFFTFDRYTLEEAEKKERQALPEGLQWGTKWEYCWFFTEVVCPEECVGERFLFEAPLGEGIVFVNGRVVGAFDKQHTHITLTDCATKGEVFKIAIEVCAGNGLGQGEDNCVILIPEEERPDEEKILRKVVKRGSYGVLNEDIFQLWLDIKLLYDLHSNMSGDSLRQVMIEKALEEMCDAVDIEAEREEFLKEVKLGREKLKSALACKNGSTAPVFYAIGHSHLDLEWLWTRQETRRKTARTLGNQLQLMKDYENYKYIQSQPWILETVKNEYPDLYKEVKKAVKDGKIIAEGGMWVEADTNIPSGESLIRQFVYGKKFIRDEFGSDSTILWLPDIFGVSGAMPQIMKGCGVKYFMNAKITWLYNGGDEIPHSNFLWQGIDGTEVLSHIIQEYATEVTPSKVFEKWEQNCEKADVPIRLYPYGWGDGGGGATRIHLENLERMKDLEGMPRMISESPCKFFKDVEETCKVDKKYSGELYYSAHRGTYTSQARTKKLNRQAEFALRQAELWDALLGEKADKTDFDKMWKCVLFSHFHDIIPGTAITEVYETVEKELSDVTAEANKIAEGIAAGVTDGEKEYITVFNPLSWDREEDITLPAGYTSLTAADGEQLSVQAADGVYKAKVKAPSCGFCSYKFGKAAVTESNRKDDKLQLENEYLVVEFNEKAELISIFDKEKKMEFLQGPSNVFRMYRDMPTFCDAWDIESFYEESEIPLEENAEIRVEYKGELMSCISISKRIHDSEITQKVVLKKGSRRIDFETEIDWRETHKLLKVDFDTNIHTEDLVSEIQFGHVKRPTHRNRAYDADRYEVCQHKWSALAEAKRGMAILNDSKYGISAKESKMSLTLLKSAAHPDRNADKGEQRFIYSLMPYVGSLCDSEVVREAYQLNVPLMTQYGRCEERSLCRVSEKNVILETVKNAEDGSGDIILRLYECMNTYTPCRIELDMPVKRAYRTDMLENNSEELAVESGSIELCFKAFEVITVRIERDSE